MVWEREREDEEGANRDLEAESGDWAGQKAGWRRDFALRGRRLGFWICWAYSGGACWRVAPRKQERLMGIFWAKRSERPGDSVTIRGGWLWKSQQSRIKMEPTAIWKDGKMGSSGVLRCGAEFARVAA